MDYAKTRPVFEGKAARCSRKYLVEHEADIATHRAARATMDRLLNGAKLPKMDTLKASFSSWLLKEKGLPGIPGSQKDMQEIITVKAILTICSA